MPSAAAISGCIEEVFWVQDACYGIFEAAFVVDYDCVKLNELCF